MSGSDIVMRTCRRAFASLTKDQRDEFLRWVAETYPKPNGVEMKTMAITLSGNTFVIQPDFGCVSWFSDDPQHLERTSGGLMTCELYEAMSVGFRLLVDYDNPDCPTGNVTAPEDQKYLDQLNTVFGTFMVLDDFAGR